jgi:hypothetical protein
VIRIVRLGAHLDESLAEWQVVIQVGDATLGEQLSSEAIEHAFVFLEEWCQVSVRVNGTANDDVALAVEVLPLLGGESGGGDHSVCATRRVFPLNYIKFGGAMQRTSLQYRRGESSVGG